MPNRADVRKGFAALLDASMTQPQVVYDHFVKDFGKQSPVVVVASGGSEHERFAFQAMKADHRLNVHIFVMRGEPGTDYTEADADDMLDAVEQELVDIVEDNPVSTPRGLWDQITWERMSEVIPLELSGDQYIMEIITLVFKEHK